MSFTKRVLLIAVVALLLATVMPGMAQAGEARIRFVHAIPGAGAVDIYVDSQLTVKTLDYGQASSYLTVTAEPHHLMVAGAGSSSPIWEQDINPSANTALTLVASSAASATFDIFQDDLNPLPLGKARFTGLHVIADGPSVDILLADGRPVIPGLTYNQPYGTLDLPVSTYELGVAPSGQPLTDALVAAQPFNLASGTSYTALVYGTTTAPQTLLLRAAVAPEAAGGYLRIAHALPNAEALDIYVNDTLAVPSLAFGGATVFIALPTGSYTVAARQPGATTDLASSSVDVTDNGYSTALIAGNVEEPTVTGFQESVSGIDTTSSILEVINAAGGATAAATGADGTSLVSGVAAGASGVAVLQPSDQSISIGESSESGTNAELTGGIYGGNLYTAVVASDGETVLLPPVSIAQTIGSAPGTVPLPTPTLAPTEVPPTAVPPTEAPQPTAVPAEPTQAPVEAQPTQASAETNAQPTAPAIFTGPIARVLTNPGVNLQLRQYPDRAALSLGLAPSGAALRVNGRAGAPVPPPDQTATPVSPEATEYVDPASVLPPGTDLDPVETWINVTFDTPDGGTITAWVNALYLGVRDQQGRAVSLRSLPTVPSNQAGTAQNTAVQPPEAQRPVTMVLATNVAAGVNVHIRRTPDTAGESLALIPAGVQVEFAGVNETRDWVFVRYIAPDGTVTGWISNEFVTLQRNGQAVNFDRLQELNELPIIPDDQRGEVVTVGQPTAGVADDLRNVVAGQVTGLNPGANLHLRRNPSDQAESLALMPTGTNMVVSARTPDDAWLNVTYQGQTGWVASSYIVLSFNGQPYEMATLPVLDPNPATPTPEASATPQS